MRALRQTLLDLARRSPAGALLHDVQLRDEEVTVYYSDDGGKTTCTLSGMDRHDAPGYLGNVTLEQVRVALNDQRAEVRRQAAF